MPRAVQSALVLILSGACGPLSKPMVDRPSAESQKIIDSSWDNMLSPRDRLAHQLLLDVVTANQLHQIGVDRLSLRSEKSIRGGLIVMEVNYDRARPDADEFVIRCVDSNGKETRRERYSRAEVEESLKRIIGPGPSAVNSAKLTEQERHEQERLRTEHEEFERRLQAATQPASS